jgi:hypothetical protein
MNSTKPITQFSSRGLRNAPVKNTRSMCRPIEATNISAAQWWICRISRPPRISKLMSSVDAMAADISSPISGTYEPSYSTSVIDGSKKKVRNVPLSRMTTKL